MGLSIRAYAKVRGVSHVAVLKAIKAGRIPIEPDGAIDPGKADAAWERSTDPGRTKIQDESEALSRESEARRGSGGGLGPRDAEGTGAAFGRPLRQRLRGHLCPGA